MIALERSLVGGRLHPGQREPLFADVLRNLPRAALQLAPERVLAQLLVLEGYHVRPLLELRPRLPARPS